MFQNKDMKISIETNLFKQLLILDLDLTKILIYNIYRIFHSNRVHESTIKLNKITINTFNLEIMCSNELKDQILKDRLN